MKKKFNQETLIIAVLTLTITLLWVYLSIYRTLKKDEKAATLETKEIQLLVPKLDTTVFEELKKRKI